MVRLEKRMKTYLDRLGINAEITKLSYIDRLFPQLGLNHEVLLFCETLENPAELEQEERVESAKYEESALDVTGSPLEHSFGDDSFDVSITQTNRNWMKNEERHQPVDRKYATECVNLFVEKLAEDGDTTWNHPVFGLSKIEGDEKTVLVGVKPDPNWFMPLRVVVNGTQTLKEIQDGLPYLIYHHLEHQKCPKKNDYDIFISSTYELCGTSHQMTDRKEIIKSDFKGYLKLEAKWNLMKFLPPPRSSSVNLVAEIISGSKGSSFSHLWDQILLLDKYLTTLQKYRKQDVNFRYSVMPLKFPDDFSTPYFKDPDIISRKLKQLLVGNDDFEETEGTENVPILETSNDEENEIKLVELVTDLDKRPNLDFTDQLWKIVRGTDSYMAMADCVHAIFEEIVERNYKPQLNISEETRFARMVSELNPEKPSVPQLAGSLSLELVIDMGIEKLSRDYMYLLSSANLMEAYDLRTSLINVSVGEFQIEKYREKLMTLAQIHLSLEFLQLIQENLSCRVDTSHIIFEAAFTKYQSPESPFKPEDLTCNKIYTLTVPAPKDFIVEVTKKSPSSWMCTLTTETDIEKFSTTTHFSKIPIFPPNIYSADSVEEENIEGAEEVYHVTNAYVTWWKLGNSPVDNY